MSDQSFEIQIKTRADVSSAVDGVNKLSGALEGAAAEGGKFASAQKELGLVLDGIAERAPELALALRALVNPYVGLGVALGVVFESASRKHEEVKQPAAGAGVNQDVIKRDEHQVDALKKSLDKLNEEIERRGSTVQELQKESSAADQNRATDDTSDFLSRAMEITSRHKARGQISDAERVFERMTAGQIASGQVNQTAVENILMAAQKNQMVQEKFISRMIAAMENLGDSWSKFEARLNALETRIETAKTYHGAQ